MTQHVRDTTAIERRLRPIYDSLEAGNNKKALQDAEKVLKKTPNLECARALKGLALLRLGRDQESLVIFQQLREQHIVDPATLQVSSCYYRETDQLSMICEIYNSAAKLTPMSEEILTQLFMSYVRVSDFKSQQSTALQLYKASPKKPYYTWAVMSVLLQATRGPDSETPTKASVLLVLAQRMLDKLVFENKLDSEHEVQLYLTILNKQKKFEEAFTFIESEVARTLYPGAPITIKIDLLKELKRWPELNILMKELLRANVDRWDYCKEYLNSVFELQRMNQTTPETDHTFELCHEFLCQLIENHSSNSRCPHMGRLELHRLMTEKGYDADELMGGFSEMIIQYFQRYGDKPCCTNDIVLFLAHVPPLLRAGLAANIYNEVSISPTTLPRSILQMRLHICSLQISRICGAHALSADHLAALCTALSLHYEYGMHVFGKNQLPTDLGVSDAYSLLAVHVMYDLAQDLQSSVRLVEALCLLHYVLANSPSNFHAKLLCLQIYHRLGCFLGAQSVYKTLDIKNIQLDSMGYLHCAHLAISGISTLSKPIYNATLKFFTTSYNDGVEYLTMCYRYGSFSKLEEFMKFRERSSNSLHYALVTTEALMQELVSLPAPTSQGLSAFRLMSIELQHEQFEWNAFEDNRDMSVIVRWDPIDLEQSFKSQVEHSFAQDIEVFKIRSTQLRLVAACIAAITKEYDDAQKTLAEIRQHWHELFAHARQCGYTPIATKFLGDLLPSRLHSLLELPYEKCLRNLADFVLATQNGGELRTIELIANIRDVARICEERIEEHNMCDDLLWGRRAVSEVVVSCVEILSICAFVIAVLHDRIVPGSAGLANKKTKQKKDCITPSHSISASIKDMPQIVSDLLAELRVQLVMCEGAVDSWKGNHSSPDPLCESLAAIHVNPKVETLICDTFTQNHQIAQKELKALLREKIRIVSK